MRLLFVTKDFPPDVGGIQTYAAEISQRFAQRCETFAVVAPGIPNTEAFDRSAPYDIIRVKGSRARFARSVLFQLRQLKARYRFNAVLGAQWQSASAAVVARRILGPYVVTCAAHGREVLTMHYAHLGAASLYDCARRYTMARVDRVFPGSRYTLGLLEERGIPVRSSQIISYGCNVERFLPEGGAAMRRSMGLEGRSILVTLSRLMPRKGIDTVLEALPAIVQQVPNVIYLVGGTGVDRSRLEQLAEQRGVRGYVRFLGMVPDAEVPPLLNMADLFVMPAREERPDVEGFGLVFLEANACGTAVLGSTSGGIPDAVVDGVTGLLVAPQDPAALATAAVRLLRDDALRAQLAQQGRARVLRDYTWGRVVDQLTESLTELLALAPAVSDPP